MVSPVHFPPVAVQGGKHASAQVGFMLRSLFTSSQVAFSPASAHAGVTVRILHESMHLDLSASGVHSWVRSHSRLQASLAPFESLLPEQARTRNKLPSIGAIPTRIQRHPMPRSVLSRV